MRYISSDFKFGQDKGFPLKSVHVDPVFYQGRIVKNLCRNIPLKFNDFQQIGVCLLLFF